MNAAVEEQEAANRPSHFITVKEIVRLQRIPAADWPKWFLSEWKKLTEETFEIDAEEGTVVLNGTKARSEDFLAMVDGKLCVLLPYNTFEATRELNRKEGRIGQFRAHTFSASQGLLEHMRLKGHEDLTKTLIEFKNQGGES